MVPARPRLVEINLLYPDLLLLHVGRMDNQG